MAKARIEPGEEKMTNMCSKMNTHMYFSSCLLFTFWRGSKTLLSPILLQPKKPSVNTNTFLLPLVPVLSVRCCSAGGRTHIHLRPPVWHHHTLWDEIIQQKFCAGTMEDVMVTQTGHPNLQAILTDMVSSILMCIHKQASLCIIIVYPSFLKKCLEGGDLPLSTDLNFPDSSYPWD